VDFQKVDVAVRLKSVDTRTASWFADMKSHIQKELSRGVYVELGPGNVPWAKMALDLRVQPGGAADAAKLIKFGERFGVEVRIKEYP
jgi:filamentous hemagglutinin